MAVSDAQRELFDRTLDRIMADLPEQLHELLERVPLIVEDEPSDLLLEEMGLDRETTELCGLHWGIPLTERSVTSTAAMPDRMMLFRGPVIRLVTRSWTGRDLPRRRRELAEQVRITVLHEIGHHFGLDEDDLAALGYG